ncbi:hypothetical protein Taro_012185 [Colocasia esculenta]|uniref:MORF/ORRM1/DAG-like MORF domain-containing protein n=1 Tax=Colocasia esculenta TaxID=4460 RepID=A0A843UC67_COLES|nr:hypothetical protein [Colocasia esculenta]
MALAATIARAIACASFAATGPGVSRSPLAAFLARRLFFAGFYSTGAPPSRGPHPPPPSPLVLPAVPRRPPPSLGRRGTAGSFEHWLIIMDKAGGEGATKQQMIDCYIQTLAKLVGSEEEAKKMIYSVCCDRYFGFGCEIDEKTSKKLGGHPGVILVLPDSYVDPEFKDYGESLEQRDDGVKK